MRKAIAIDFDGCLCTNEYPAIGQPNWPVINKAKEEQQAGAGLILWTCREGQLLRDAVDACVTWGLHFDTVNESLDDWIRAYGTAPRKVGASEYWDDQAITIQPIPLTLEQIRGMEGEPVWVEDLLISKCSCYHFVQKIGDHVLLMEPRYYPAEDVMIPHYCANDENQGYGRTWLAYRRKEDAHHGP